MSLTPVINYYCCYQLRQAEQLLLYEALLIELSSCTRPALREQESPFKVTNPVLILPTRGVWLLLDAKDLKSRIILNGSPLRLKLTLARLMCDMNEGAEHTIIIN